VRAPSYKVAVTVVYILGLFIQILDATIVNVALPTLADDFGVPVTEVDWVIVGYLLALASAIPAAGWLSDRFGSKKVFLGALAVFTVSSGLCGAATSLEMLVAFRLLQGLGAGLITPVGSAILFRAYPMAERARAAAAVVGVAVIAPAVGPALGGIIVDTISWRWIFFVNLPIGIAGMALGLMWLREEVVEGAGRFDGPGLLLASAGLALLLYGLSLGPDDGWAAPTTLAALSGAVGGFVLLVRRELRIDAPLLHLRLFTERLFRTANIAGLSIYAGFLGQIFLFTLYLQDLRGISATGAGFTQAPQAVGVFVLSNVAGRRLYMAVGPRRLMVAGAAGTGIVTAVFALTDTTTPLGLLAFMNFCRGLTIGLVFVTIQTAVYARISNADTAKATTLFSVQRQSANALGVAIVATVLAALAPASRSVGPIDAAAGLSAYRWAFVVCALLFVPGVIASWSIRDEDAAETRGLVPTGAARPEPA
jgi:EmrB/QacA subfamily drug resistance transporter